LKGITWFISGNGPDGRIQQSILIDIKWRRKGGVDSLKTKYLNDGEGIKDSEQEEVKKRNRGLEL